MKQLLQNHTCAVRTAQGDILTSDERGIRPALQWLREDRDILHDAEVADKVVGKAAALLFAFGGVRYLWAECMSDAAIAFLEQSSVSFEYERRTERIINRDGTGLCPMESRAMPIDDPAEAFALFDGMIP